MLKHNQSAIQNCPSDDIIVVGLVHKFIICGRKDDPIIYKWLKHDKQWGFFLEYETILAHRGGGPFHIVEIGGNIGINAIHSAVLGHEVIVFEPQPELAGYIKLNADINEVGSRVSIHQLGLSNSIGSTKFMIDRLNRGGSHIIEDASSNSNPDILNIKMQTLDSMNISNKIFLMKIDVESHELKVLQGGINLLSNTNLKPEIILLEFGYPKQNPREILKLLYEVLKYEIYIVDYWLPGGQERHVLPWRKVHPTCFNQLCNYIKVYVDIAAVSGTFQEEYPFLANTMGLEGGPALSEFSYNRC